VGGGCIARACTAEFVDGSTVFVKTFSQQPGLFEAEAEGLKALRGAEAIRVPQVLAVETDGLVLEWIREGPRKKGFAENFGRRFAQLHQHRGRVCGFTGDNFIGATPQINTPVKGNWQEARKFLGSDWPEFFIERRLRFQVRLASERGHGDELARLLDRAEARIATLLGSAIEAPSLLHGDLWGGNYLVDDRGEPCLIDPAVYFGHREADLAMTRLFGGFEPAFYSAYHQVLPLAPGHRERLPIYQLYHVINHLNLFGGGYYGQAQRILQNLAG
jgi:fructosamine-3-kinase